MRRCACLLLAAVLGACAQADVDFKQARHLEDGGEFLRALSAYDAFIRKHTADPRLPEASFRAGRLFAGKVGDCAKAVPHFERAARGGGDWAAKAQAAILDCPDYFPLRAGAAWTFVDSLSLGENMRMNVGLSLSSSSPGGLLRGEMYAGELKIRDIDATLLKEGWTIYEVAGGDKMPILKYPFQQGSTWQGARQGRRVTYTIVGVGMPVRTKAGRFSGCLKVRERTEGYESWVFDYYCPGVGRVKKTVGVVGEENPNTELAAYRMPEA